MSPRVPASESIQIVVNGAFNPAIFSQHWLQLQGLIGEEDAEGAKVKVVSPNGTEISFPESFSLTCTKEQFIVETLDIAYSRKMSDLAVGILRRLGHTPCYACGINPRAHYAIETIEYWHKIGHTLAPKEKVWHALFAQPGLQAIVIKAPRTGEFPGESNITVGPSLEIKPGLFIQSNEHYPAPDPKRESATQIAAYISSYWTEATNAARKVATQIFKDIPPDHAD